MREISKEEFLAETHEAVVLRLGESMSPGSEPGYTTDQAEGAIPNGTIVEKCGSEPGDAHVNGDLAIILGSLGPVDGLPGNARYGYFIIWRSHPDLPCFITGHRIRERNL